MIRLLSFCMCLLSLLGAFVFGVSTVPCLIIAAACLVLFVFAGKLMQKKLFALLFGAGFAVVLLFGMTLELGVIDGGTTDYNRRLEKTGKYIADEKLERAKEELDYLEENYRQTDLFRYEKMMYFLTAQQYDEAMSMVESFENKTGRGYFEAKEMCMFAQEDRYEDYEYLNLYREAADANPDWAYANFHAGMYYADREEWKPAEYYLRIAYDCAELTYDVPFYLGLLCCEQGRLEEGIGFFEESFYLGAPEEYQEIMEYYIGKVY